MLLKRSNFYLISVRVWNKNINAVQNFAITSSLADKLWNKVTNTLFHALRIAKVENTVLFNVFSYLGHLKLSLHNWELKTE